MKAEKRDNIMARFLASFDFQRDDKLIVNSDTKEAIVECYRLTKAWDELRAWVADSSSIASKMDELIPSEPADKLEKLRIWLGPVNDNWAKIGHIKRKIKELQDEDR